MSDPAKYLLIPGESLVRIHATSSVHPIDGEATGIEGEISLSVVGGEPDTSKPIVANVEFPVKALKSGNPAYDAEMNRRLDERRYPKISGQLTSVETGGSDGKYRVTGNLSFHGATRTVVTDMDVHLDGTDRLTARWEQTIDIQNFNMKPPRILMFKVDPEVRIEVDLVAERESERIVE